MIQCNKQTLVNCNSMKKTLVMVLLLAVYAQVYAIFPIQIVNNSQFADNEIYIGIVGKQPSGADIYYDLTNNSASNVALPALTASLNTLHKTNGDWGYANIFTTLDKISNKTIYVTQSLACRMFIGFRSPMYLHVHDGGGYAGADLNNPSDPNADLRWELVEFSYDTHDVMFVNTTRVDAFQYPMGVELYGNVAAGANNAYMKRGDLKSYATTISDWQTEFGGTIYADCQINRIQKDDLGPIIMQPSKVASVKSSNEFDEYIAAIWSTFTNKTLRCNMGDRGEWYGKVENGVFVMHNAADPNRVGRVGRPSTVDVIEGAGAFATGSEDDKATQAQFCGAINRGMIDLDKADNELQQWGDRTAFFTRNNWNKYVAFFHDAARSYDGYTYAFCYDDTFDQSSTCATSHPDHLVVTIGGFTTNPGETVDPGTDPTPNPDKPNPGDETGNTTSGTTEQGLQYQCQITQQGMDVTYTFSVTNAGEFVGLVPVIWDNSNGFREEVGVSTITFKNCSLGQKLSVACKWMYAGGDTHTPYIDYTVSNIGSSIEVITTDTPMRKVLYNGQLYILSGEVLYTITGQAVGSVSQLLAQ